MKLHFTSMLVALAASTVAAAAPDAAPPVPAKVQASSAQSLELARRFVNLSLSPDRYLEITRAQFSAGAYVQLEGIKDPKVRAEADKDLNEVFARIEPKMREQLPKLLDAYAQLYAREYSPDELQQLILFAGSPVGQHYLARRRLVEEDESVLDAQMEMMKAVMPVMEQFRKE
jgi:hypothetical protein